MDKPPEKTTLDWWVESICTEFVSQEQGDLEYDVNQRVPNELYEKILKGLRSQDREVYG